MSDSGKETVTDQEVFEWIKSHYEQYMTPRLLEIHRRILVDQERFDILPGDLDKVLQTVRHARACIAAGHEPLAGKE